ncbi:MAG: helix-turn-helix transcriptional regulator [Clostridia bacterium]|nr:helix-turn-helix transcriptional regulator [Clostridia bacterium]
MSSYDNKIFGQNLRKYRKMKELSQENIAMLLGKTKATISKYENGELIMTANDIAKVCDELGIYSSDLFEQEYKNINKDNSNNPFKSKKLYVYFYAYDYKSRKYGKGKYILDITERPDFVRVDYSVYGDSKTYMRGYMHADRSVAFISLENYEPNSARLDHAIIEINIANGVNGLMLGTLTGTNAQYVPSIRKCYFSQKDVEFTDEMLEELKPTENELQMLKDTNALYLDIFNN